MYFAPQTLKLGYGPVHNFLVEGLKVFPL